MYANDVRFANAIFMVQWIYVQLFTYIRLRFASSDGRFAAPIFRSGSEKFAFGRIFALTSIVESDMCRQKSRENIARRKSAV